MHKILPSGGFLGRLLAQVQKPRLSLTGNALRPLAKNVLMPLRLTEQHQQQMQLFIKEYLDLVLQY